MMGVSKNLPLGTLIVDGVEELQANVHALRNGSVESVFPSDLAPKLSTL